MVMFKATFCHWCFVWRSSVTCHARPLDLQRISVLDICTGSVRQWNWNLFESEYLIYRMIWVCRFFWNENNFKPVLLRYSCYICMKEMWLFWAAKTPRGREESLPIPGEVMSGWRSSTCWAGPGRDLGRSQPCCYLAQGAVPTRREVNRVMLRFFDIHVVNSDFRLRCGFKICHQGRFGRSCADATWGASLEHAGGTDPRQDLANGDGASRWHFRGTLPATNVNGGKIWWI